MNGKIEEFFKSEGVEYYSAIAYSDCVEINKNIIEREALKPRSVIVFLLPYYTGETVNLSRYAASLDYHIAIREIGDRLIDTLKSIYPDNSFRVYGDHSPIIEFDAALKCGLGIKGDNGLLINERYGTYVFIADVVTDVPPELLGCKNPSEFSYKSCIGCGACKNACPTGVLSGSSFDCLSAITQRKGELSKEEIALMKEYNTVWGCDECQSNCPYNKNPRKTPLEFFGKDRIEKLTTEIVSKMDRAEFSRRAFAWRGKKTVMRNLEKLGY